MYKRQVLVGDGPLTARLQTRYPDVIFPGMRIGADLAAHYASADLFLFPSLTETCLLYTSEMSLIAQPCRELLQRCGASSLRLSVIESSHGLHQSFV